MGSKGKRKATTGKTTSKDTVKVTVDDVTTTAIAAKTETAGVGERAAAVVAAMTAATAVTAKVTTTAIATHKETETTTTVSDFQVPVSSQNISELMVEEMEGLDMRFDRVRLSMEGELAFEIHSASTDDVDRRIELVGVIVDKHPINAYYASSFDGQKNPPDCSSLDGITGYGNPAGNCRVCPMNRYGTGRDKSGNGTKGKACQNKYRIYLLQSGELYPLLLTLPASSLKSFSNFMTKSIVAKGLRSNEVITRISLKQMANSAGTSYAEVQFSMDGVLDMITAYEITYYSKGIRQLTRQLTVFQDNDGATIEEQASQLLTNDGTTGAY